MKPSRPELDHYIKQQEAILHEVTALRGPIEERRFCGAIFHIHSTNEVCASCMEHLLYEFEHSEDFQDIRNKAKGLLYLIVTCDNDGLQDGPNRPGGGAKEVLEGSHDIFDLLGEEKYIQFKLKTTEQVSGKGRQSTLRARASSSAASSSSARN